MVDERAHEGWERVTGSTGEQGQDAVPPEAEEALERIEEARSEAATYAVQRPEERERIAPDEERLMDAVEAAAETPPDDVGRLEDLAERAEEARDAISEDIEGSRPG